jgi:uncharacterized protein YjdB
VQYTIAKATQTITASNKTVTQKSTVDLGAKTNGGGALSYKSSNTKVATVNAQGKVTGVSAGTVTITITAAETGNYRAATRTITVKVNALADPHVSYRTHVQKKGWQKYVTDGAMSGTSGKSLRLEGINIKLTNLPYSGGIQYRTHVQKIGWQGWRKDNAMAGTSGKSYRLEAIQIKLYGELAKHYDVYYRVHAQKFGWMGWAKNGAQSGTAGYSYRLEGIQVVLVKKGDPAPARTLKGITQRVAQPFRQKGKK